MYSDWNFFDFLISKDPAAKTLMDDTIISDNCCNAGCPFFKPKLYNVDMYLL